MTGQAIRLSFRTFLMIATLSILSAALSAAAQEPPAKDAKAKPEKEAGLSEEVKATRLAEEKLVSRIEVETQTDDDKWTKVKRIEKPLLYFTEDTDIRWVGSLWAWGDQGRPVAVLELYQNNGGRWNFGIFNTSGGKVRASRDGNPWWSENQSDVIVTDIQRAPAPAAEAPQRQRQLKLLAQKFTGHEVRPNNSRFELRRLERPVQTYRDADHGLLEGGLFIFAYGTNPELLLFVEARADPKDKSKAVWQFLVGRATSMALHLESDGKEVFACPNARGLNGPKKPYWIGGFPVESNADPKK
jgi:hypothetical protein